jgi:hypothetical protein
VYTCGPFELPVDTGEYPDYADVIGEPMALQTVRERVCASPADGGYSSPDEMHRDVRLVFSNCYKYNNDPEAGADVRFMAVSLSAYFDDVYADQFGKHMNAAGEGAGGVEKRGMRGKQAQGGVFWEAESQQWHAYTMIATRRVVLGAFETKEASLTAFDEAERASSSKYYGVHWDRDAESWMAELTIRGKKQVIGQFAREVDAARAFDAAAETNGLSVELNFPRSGGEGGGGGGGGAAGRGLRKKKKDGGGGKSAFGSKGRRARSINESKTADPAETAGLRTGSGGSNGGGRGGGKSGGGRKGAASSSDKSASRKRRRASAEEEDHRGRANGNEEDEDEDEEEDEVDDDDDEDEEDEQQQQRAGGRTNSANGRGGKSRKSGGAAGRGAGGGGGEFDGGGKAALQVEVRRLQETEVHLGGQLNKVRGEEWGGR